MSKEIYISSTPHETRLAIVEKDELTEIYYERENEYTLAGSIYNGRVTRVLPGMQSSFVDIGLERDAFLYITDFMEEAGDAADFEPAVNANGAAGANGGGRPRNGERPARGESRDRGRGRRDERGRNERGSEGQDGAANPSVSEEPQEFAGPRGIAPSYGEYGEEAVGEPEAASGEEVGEGVGEGAQGADGGRRWRGRRGRRRGRGNPEIGVSGEPNGNVVEERSPEPETRTSRAPREDSFGNQDRGRGGRDREAKRADQPGNEGRHEAVRERFAPRARGGPDRGESRDAGVDLSAAAEPFILPGESLSKYRRGEQAADESASHSAPFSALPLKAKASTEAEPLAGWDGGLVLPGETLSRHREPNRETRGEGRSQARSETSGADLRDVSQRERGEQGRDRGSERGSDRGRDRRRERDQRSGRDAAPRSTYSAQPRGLDPAEAVLPAVTSQHEPEATALPFSDDAPDFAIAATESWLETGHAATENAELEPTTEAIYQSQIESQPETAEEFHETVAEYEPGEDASASYRVDPAAASEFRQSAPVEEFAGTAEAHEVSQTSLSAHEFTALQPTGEMLPEPTHAPDAPASPATQVGSPTSPIENEAAIHDAQADEALAEAVKYPATQSGHQPAASASFEPGAVSASFEPGDGQLEEELMDDEETEIGSLHASAFDPDTEEETLENVSGDVPDLGSMIRDMSIDQMTRSEPVDLDEEDEEEDEDFDSDEEDFEEDELESTAGDSDDEAESDDEISGSEISESEEDEFAEGRSFDEPGHEGGSRDAVAENAAGGERARGPAREGDRRDRRDGRRGGRGERTGDRGSDRGSRDRRGMANSGTGSSRTGGSHSRGHGERGGRSMQSTNLPAISDLLKPGQEVLVQIAKEPIAKKGARITSHIALPGRFLVFMPTVNHVGVSRKIESDGERRRLKEILLSEKGDASGGFIVRTAASGASEEELRSDLRFLLNLWTDIKQRSESSKSPALIYHDLNLVERILRDQVTDNFSAIWVDTETEYERVLRFLQRFQPSLIRRVKLYTKDTPLFEQFGITEEINKALRSKVWLKSGGSIVINQTEALVAIDINTGKYVGKTARLEDTIVKTNLDAIPEIVRQIRLRDLGGIIIIDFIDMDERKNRNRVMAALEDELKSDRAPSKVLQFNDFGLVAITRKRVKQSLERTLSSTCGVCQGTGMTKSPVTVCNDIYIEMRKMHKVIEKGDIMLRVNPEVVKQLKSGSGKWLQEMEEMSGKTILVKSDPSLHPEQFDIH